MHDVMHQAVLGRRFAGVLTFSLLLLSVGVVRPVMVPSFEKQIAALQYRFEQTKQKSHDV